MKMTTRKPVAAKPTVKLTAAQKAAVKAGGKVEPSPLAAAEQVETQPVRINMIAKRKAAATKKTGMTPPSKTRTPAETKALVKKAKALTAQGVKPGTMANPIIATFDGKPPKGVTKKPAAPVVKYKGQIIPVKRKNGTEGLDVPTIEVKNVAETMKVLALMPKGATWLTERNDTINVFNASGALIAELRTIGRTTGKL